MSAKEELVPVFRYEFYRTFVIRNLKCEVFLEFREDFGCSYPSETFIEDQVRGFLEDNEHNLINGRSRKIRRSWTALLATFPVSKGTVKWTVLDSRSLSRNVVEASSLFSAELIKKSSGVSGSDDEDDESEDI